jgi:endogenous inhibitor of DNA gyrase (YacG/DUF329 family)
LKPYQKHRIAMMRGKGATYATIAAEIGVSESTIQSHCRRNGITNTYEKCPECGKRLEHIQKKKPKRFCSDKCRMAWWAKNPDAINRQAVYNFICSQCKEPFSAYGNAKRKYCSQACAVAARGVKGNHDKDNHPQQSEICV